MATDKLIPGNLQGVIDHLQSDDSLPKERKTEWCSAVRTFARCVGRDPSELDANPTALRAIERYAKPTLLGLGSASYANTKSRMKAALKHVGIAVDVRRNMPLAKPWEDLLSKLEKRHRIELRKFAGRCSALGIDPGAVAQETFKGYFQFLHEQSIQQRPRERWYRALRAWNAGVAVSGTAYPKIENPFGRIEESLSWDKFPESLRKEIAEYREAVTKPKLFGDRRKPIKPRTVSGHLDNLRRLASHLVKSGVPIEKFSSLRVFFDSILVERGLELMQAAILAARADANARRSTMIHAELRAMHEDPTSPLPSLQATAFAIRSLASYFKLSGEAWDRIREISAAVRTRRIGMTQKNKARLNQLNDPRAKALLLGLPDDIARRLEKVTHPTFKEARLMQLAAILRLLSSMPVRLENVRNLDLDRHFQRPVGDGPGKWLVSIPAHEVKNDQDIDCELSEETSALLDRYVKVFRPVLTKVPSSILFVSRTGKAKCAASISREFSEFIRKKTGLAVHAHLMRHFAVNNWLNEYQGDYEGARQLLSHTSIDTTRKHYAGMEHRKALSRYGDLVERQRAESTRLRAREFNFKRRRKGAYRDGAQA